MGTKITKIGITNDKISARGGFTFFLRYIEQTGLYNLILGAMLPLLIRSSKGLQLQGFLKQIFAFFIDGTDMSIAGFDQKKKGEGYISLLENSKVEMASSHQVKRYFSKISIVNDLVFNKILHELFIWRIKITKPTIIELGIDTMVMDNDYAKKREGNKLIVWTKFRRCIYTDVTRDENGQYLMGLKRTDSFIYTNIGTCPIADKKLKSAGGEHYFETEAIIHRSHQRGADELIHRSIKELATKEQLPEGRVLVKGKLYSV